MGLSDPVAAGSDERQVAVPESGVQAVTELLAPAPRPCQFVSVRGVASVALGVAGVVLVCVAVVEAGWIAQRIWRRWFR